MGSSMKKYLLALVLFIPSLASAELYDFKILRTVDGDTVKIEAPFLPAPLKPELSIRVLGVDTPEKGSLAKCQSEKDKAKDASAFTKDFVTKGKIKVIELKGWDKYGGRVLGDIIVDGTRLSDALINGGYARAYDGGKKSSWCN